MTKIQLRRGSTTQWSTANPVLSLGELGLDNTLGDIKIGDGVTTWNSLPLYSTGLKPDNGGKPIGKGEILVNAKDYIVANGIADDLAGMTNAFNAGDIISLPANATIYLGGILNVPAGKSIITNGAKFKGLADSGNYVLTLASNTNVWGPLTINTTGTNVRGLKIAGNNVRIDKLIATAPLAGGGAGDLRDNALAISGSVGVDIGVVEITNFDYACRLEASSDISITMYNVTSYVQGMYISESKRLNIAGGYLRVASPNAAILPGHNGFLIDALTHEGTTDISFNNLLVSDSGEHGYRIGGDKKVKRVWYNSCSAVNIGGSGFKVLGGQIADNNYHEDIFYADCLVEDAGQQVGNSCGFQLEFVKGVKLTNPIVRKNLKTYSCGQGIQIQAGENVHVLNPTVEASLDACYKVGFVLGNSTEVHLYGGQLTSTSGMGIVLDYTNRTFRRVDIQNHPTVNISGSGFGVSIVGTGGSIIGGSWITWQSIQAANLQIDPASAMGGYFIDVRAPFTAGGFAFKNGSTWIDNASGIHYRKNALGWYLQDQVGTTATRPASAPIGQEYYDTTLNKPIRLKSTGPNVWIDYAGTTV